MISGTKTQQLFLRWFSKLTCFSTLFLIFVGGMVTSTGSGLSVPDWPLSYGMLFPPMVGGVFYEHGHRMVASGVGFFTLCLAIFLAKWERRRWVRNLGFGALGAVILQGILGGITVLLFLPPPVSILHGVLAQTFFILTIVIAYSQSVERENRSKTQDVKSDSGWLRFSVLTIVLVYLQLIIGAMMRHTGSGLAIPDFPTMGGQMWPAFDTGMLFRINDWRFEHNLDPIALGHVVIHLAHRVGALLIFIIIVVLTGLGLSRYPAGRIRGTIVLLNSLVLFQIFLGAVTVLSIKEPHITSLHVATGAAILGTAVLLFLRAAPLKWPETKRLLKI